MNGIYECPYCEYKVESINDLQRCGHCGKVSCPNCNTPIYEREFPKEWLTVEAER